MVLKRQEQVESNRLSSHLKGNSKPRIMTSLGDCRKLITLMLIYLDGAAEKIKGEAGAQLSW